MILTTVLATRNRNVSRMELGGRAVERVNGGYMKVNQAITGVLILIMNAVVAVGAQDKAAVRTEKMGPFRAGGPISFVVKLNEPLPKGGHFDLRISPVSADEEIPLGTGEPVNGSDTDFRVSTTLPEAAVPGEWHISVIWLFLPGAGWTHTSIAPNDLRFQVEGKAYPIPTKADVSVGR
jgi:hypothetical protein